MKNRISQSQIAKELGVSQSLVSLVLNGRRENVSDESYNRIWTLAAEKGYIPRGMQPGHAPDIQRGYVGMILRSGLKLTAESNTYSHVQQGLYMTLQKSHISTTFLGVEGELDEIMLYELLKRRDPLQAIVICGEVHQPFLVALSELGVDLLSVYASAPGLCHSVVPNEKQSAEQLIGHMVELGHTRFAWLGDSSKLQRNNDRLKALKESLADRKLEFDEQYIVDMPNGTRQAGFDCAEELMRRAKDRERPTAWICHNGLMARGALQYGLLRGIKIPEEISLAGIDRTRVCTEIHPDLTSAGSDPLAIGAEAAKLISGSADDSRNGDKIFTDLVVPSIFNAGETSAQCAG